jgi:RNA polymerase sigma factor (sigma-70 family)
MNDDLQNSFDPFAHRLREPLRQAALRIIREPAEADDVVQETLLAVWQRWRNGSIDDLRAYAMRAVTINAIKRRTRRRKFVALGEMPSPEQSSPRMNPAELERAIAQLPLGQQTVVRLRFYVGLSFREIASRLRISTNTAASRVRYALVNLRKHLHEDES